MSPIVHRNMKISSIFTSYGMKTERGWLYTLPDRDGVIISGDGDLNNTVNISRSGILQLRRGCAAFTCCATLIVYQQM